MGSGLASRLGTVMGLGAIMGRPDRGRTSMASNRHRLVWDTQASRRFRHGRGTPPRLKPDRTPGIIDTPRRQHPARVILKPSGVSNKQRQFRQASRIIRNTPRIQPEPASRLIIRNERRIFQPSRRLRHAPWRIVITARKRL